MPTKDSLIAATALVHGLAIAARNRVDGAYGRCSAPQPAHHREAVGAVALAVACLILVHRHVQHPVQASDAGIGVLNGPMGAHHAPEAFGRHLRTQEGEARLLAVFAFRVPLRNHLRFRGGGSHQHLVQIVACGITVL